MCSEMASRISEPLVTAKPYPKRSGKEKTFYVELTQREDTESQVKGELKSTGKLGLKLRELTPDMARQLGYSEDEKGVLVTNVEQGSKSESAGIRQGDVIKEINHTLVTTPKEVKKQLKKLKSGNSVQILIKRANVGLIVMKVIV